jgi:effector-binding domain-containing protein
MAYRFLIKDIAPQRLVVRRARTAAFEWGDTLSALFASVWDHLNTGFESVTVGPPMARFREIDAVTVEVEAGFPIAEPVAPQGDFVLVELRPGRAATTLHEGPYERLSEAQAGLEDWIAEQGLHVESTPWLIFWATPDDVDIPAELRTELVWPIAVAGG